MSGAFCLPFASARFAQQSFAAMLGVSLAACLALPQGRAADEPAAEAGDDACAELFGLMYWTHRDEGVYRACRDGSQVELLAPIKNVDGLAIDTEGGKIYFTVSRHPEVNADKLMRANLDGSGVEELAQGLNFTGDLALDAKAKKLYLSRVGDGVIMQCNLDGSELKEWLAGLGSVDEMAFDARARQLYWVQGGAIKRASVDDARVEGLGAINDAAMGIALDLENQRLFFATRDNGAIASISLDGGQRRQIVAGLSGVDGLAYDPYNRKLYWTEPAKICQANDDGSEIETLVPGKSHRFGSIVVLPPKQAD